MKQSPFPAGPCTVGQRQVFEGGKAIKGRQTGFRHSQLSTTVDINPHQDNHYTILIMTTHALPMASRSNIAETAVCPVFDAASIWQCSMDANSFQQVTFVPGHYRIKFDAAKPTEQDSFNECDEDWNIRTNGQSVKLTCSPLEELDDPESTLSESAIVRLKALSGVRQRDIHGDCGTPLENAYEIYLSHNSQVFLSVDGDGQIEEQSGDRYSYRPLFMDSRGKTIQSKQARPSIPHRRPH